MIYLQPTDAYEYFNNKIPPRLQNKTKLIVVHYKYDSKCTRWTTRTRDIRKKRAKKLEFDCCAGYLVDNTISDKLSSAYFICDTTVMFVGYRLYGESWVEVVDSLNFSEISWIEGV